MLFNLFHGTVESRCLEPPRETEIGSKNQRWHEITLDLRDIVS